MTGLLGLHPIEPPSLLKPTMGAPNDFESSAAIMFEEQSKNWSSHGAKIMLEEEIFDAISSHNLTGFYGFVNDEYADSDWANNGDEESALDQIFQFAIDGVELTSPRAKRFRDELEATEGAPSLEDLVSRVQERASGIELERVKADARGQNIFGSLAGGMAGSFTFADPENLTSLLIPSAGKTASLTRKISTDMGLNMAVEGYKQFTAVERNRYYLGLPLDRRDQIENVLFAGVGAGLLRGAFEGVGFGLKKLKDAPKFSTNERLAAYVAADRDLVRKSNPLADNGKPASKYEAAVHQRLADEAPARVGDLEDGEYIFDVVKLNDGPNAIDDALKQLSPELHANIEAVDARISEIDTKINQRLMSSVGAELQANARNIAAQHQAAAFARSQDPELHGRFSEIQSRLKNLEGEIEQAKTLTPKKKRAEVVRNLKAERAELTKESEAMTPKVERSLKDALAKDDVKPEAATVPPDPELNKLYAQKGELAAKRTRLEDARTSLKQSAETSRTHVKNSVSDGEVETIRSTVADNDAGALESNVIEFDEMRNALEADEALASTSIVTDDGRLVPMREFLNEIQDDSDLVDAMKVCAL